MFVEGTYCFKLKDLYKSPTLRKHEETLIGSRFSHCVWWSIFSSPKVSIGLHRPQHEFRISILMLPFIWC